MNWSKYSGPCIGAVLALQFVEFGHLTHPCSDNAADLARCNALPGQDAPDGPQEGVTLFGFAQATATITASTAITASSVSLIPK
jgi:hypothetical protein